MDNFCLNLSFVELFRLNILSFICIVYNYTVKTSIILYTHELHLSFSIKDDSIKCLVLPSPHTYFATVIKSMPIDQS